MSSREASNFSNRAAVGKNPPSPICLGRCTHSLTEQRLRSNRWKAQNLYIEAAKLLVDHYDHWLEEYERVRETKQPGLHDPVDFVFTYDFPHDAETRFRETYKQIWTALYGGTAP